MYRYDIINELIYKYKFKKYLEIGVRNPNECFDLVNCETKHSVDPGYENPNAEIDYKLTSDDFFSLLESGELDLDPNHKWDVIFIDGLHISNQVEKDFENSLRHLTDDGIIVLHDCNPSDLWFAREDYIIDGVAHGWNGTVWKVIYNLRATRPDLFVCTVDTDYGIGIIKRGSQECCELDNPYYEYRQFEKDRKNALNLISIDEFKQIFGVKTMVDRYYKNFNELGLTNPKNDLEEYFMESKNTKNIHKWFHYFEIYDRYFSKYRNTEINILEIGVESGGSLQMWKEYFGPKAKIYGVDVNPNCKNYEEDQIEIHIGSQEDREFWSDIKQKLPKFDIIIDDGGHTMVQQIVTYEEMFDHLKYDGIYLCEDLHTSYLEEWGGGHKNPNTFIEYSKNFIDYLHYWYIRNTNIPYETKNMFGVHFYDSVLVIEKRDINEPFHCDNGVLTEKR